jgi:hypothetical protein
MRYEDLDHETRRWMYEEFMHEESTDPYRSPTLSAKGKKVFPVAMERAIAEGDEDTLTKALGAPDLWAPFEPSPQGGVRPVDPARAARSLARMEFNTWYVRGLCRRLFEEGETVVQVYRAAEEDAPGDECKAFENLFLEVRYLYNGHRIKYWPVRNERAFSIPCGPQCRHTIRRVSPGARAMLELEEQQFGGAFRRSGP